MRCNGLCAGYKIEVFRNDLQPFWREIPPCLEGVGSPTFYYCEACILCSYGCHRPGNKAEIEIGCKCIATESTCRMHLTHLAHQFLTNLEATSDSWGCLVTAARPSSTGLCTAVAANQASLASCQLSTALTMLHRLLLHACSNT